MKNNRSGIQIVNAEFKFLPIHYFISAQPFKLHAGIYPIVFQLSGSKFLSWICVRKRDAEIPVMKRTFFNKQSIIVKIF